MDVLNETSATKSPCVLVWDSVYFLHIYFIILLELFFTPRPKNTKMYHGLVILCQKKINYWSTVLSARNVFTIIPIVCTFNVHTIFTFKETTVWLNCQTKKKFQGY